MENTNSWFGYTYKMIGVRKLIFHLEPNTREM